MQAQRQIIDSRTHKYVITRRGKTLTYADAINLWESNEEFRRFFVSLLSDSPFSAYRWETPPISTNTLSREFQFVLLDSPGLAHLPDSLAFADHYVNANDDSIVVFENLGQDAVLVVPTPQSEDLHYAHLASFVRHAPRHQIHALWRVVGETVKAKLSDRPLWLSTAGGGVAWLHVRLDVRPKYYRHKPYQLHAEDDLKDDG